MLKRESLNLNGLPLGIPHSSCRLWILQTGWWNCVNTLLALCIHSSIFPADEAFVRMEIISHPLHSMNELSECHCSGPYWRSVVTIAQAGVFLPKTQCTCVSVPAVPGFDELADKLVQPLSIAQQQTLGSGDGIPRDVKWRQRQPPPSGPLKEEEWVLNQCVSWTVFVFLDLL